jgi:hypothetical protein
MLDAPPYLVDPESRFLLLGHLAAQALAGVPGIAEALPADDPIIAQMESAREALDAYCAGNEPALSQSLKAISFRSPYRDLVQILKALTCLVPAARDARGDGCREAMLARHRGLQQHVLGPRRLVGPVRSSELTRRDKGEEETGGDLRGGRNGPHR